MRDALPLMINLEDVCTSNAAIIVGNRVGKNTYCAFVSVTSNVVVLNRGFLINN